MPKDEFYDTHLENPEVPPCVLINDIESYFNDRGSTVYICSVDAEKCFDSVLYDAPFV